MSKVLEALRNPDDYIFSHGLSKKLQPLTGEVGVSHVAVKNNKGYDVKVPLSSEDVKIIYERYSEG